MRTATFLPIVALMCLIPGFVSDAQTNAPGDPARPDSSATSLDWEGVYRGVVPCADCEGIETTVTLARNGSYRLETRYLGKSDTRFEHQGVFTWNPEGNVITLEGLQNRPSRYLVSENHLVQLDLEGKRITGPLADRYRLPKLGSQPGPEAAPLTETTWTLTELSRPGWPRSPGSRRGKRPSEWR